MTSAKAQALLRRLLLVLYQGAYWFARSLLFRLSPNTSHALVQELLGRWDNQARLQAALSGLGRLLRPTAPVAAGAVALPQPFILAASWIKGAGYDNETQALGAVIKDSNLLPGWRTLPHLAGPVEFGSYTRWPRHGNPSPTMWRDARAASLGNRVGLRNPGIRAAVSFLAMHKDRLPACYGINLACSPQTQDARALRTEMAESVLYLAESALTPSWLTLNVSCPSHDDDVTLRQTTENARAILEGAQEMRPPSLPLWLKVSPCLSAAQYDALLQLGVEYGVKAIVATNARQETDEDGLTRGISGQALASDARAALVKLVTLKRMRRVDIDIIACGGIGRGRDLAWLKRLQVQAWQYSTALVYRGPLAASLIYWEAQAASARRAKRASAPHTADA